MKGRFFIDTDIIFYIFDKENDKKSEKARSILKSALDSENGAISFQVIQEFCNAALKKFKKPVTIEDCRYFINRFLYPICEVFPVDKIIYMINLIDTNTKYMCITGGEPTLLKEKLFDILDCCGCRLPYTIFTLLTNARMFSYKDYTCEFNLHKPKKLILGVPIYGDSPAVHDSITNTSGSFMQTVNGIRNLLKSGNKVELRIVVNRMNYKHLFDLSNFIASNFPNVIKVNIMALEMLGNAIVNKKRVWIDFEEMKDNLKKVAVNMIGKGITTYLYNFPLCCIDESLWTIAMKSISDYKVRYFEECEVCSVKEKCGGFFNSTINLKELKIRPVV